MSWFSSLKKARAQKYQAIENEEDFLLITWDSCRFDAYVKAKTPRLDAYCEPRKAYAHGTYTLPSHVAMFQGFLPHAHIDEPFYNRYVQQVWRISHRKIHTKPLVTFPPHTKSIVTGFQQRGYFTAGVAAMYWFNDADTLRDGYEYFEVTGFDAQKQNELLLEQIGKQPSNRPYFAFVNYGETHSPFRYAGMAEPENKVDERFSLARLFNQKGVKRTDWKFDEESFGRQVACAEFLDTKTAELIEDLKTRGRPLTIVICGDHGECFGEDGLWGHSFYHEKVMEVPLLIFRVNGPPHEPPVASLEAPAEPTEKLH